MLKEVVNTSNSLEELLKQNDFEFINTLENNLDEIHLKISEQKNKRKKVISLVKLSNDEEKKKEFHDIDHINLSECKDMINLINSNINSLYTLEVDLNNLSQNFTDSYISNFFEDHNDSAFEFIKENISKYSNELTEFNNKFTENTEKIDMFLDKNLKLIDKKASNTKNSFANFPTNISSSEDIIADDEHSDNLYLIVSEENKKVFLPYKVSEIKSYLEKYPNSYSNFDDVVEKEFILSLDYYTRNPAMTRFRETYSLIRDREAKSVIEALKYSFDLMFRDDLNPTIISACKTQQQLDDYLTCLEHKNLSNFKHFKIQFHVSPLVTKE